VGFFVAVGVGFFVAVGTGAAFHVQHIDPLTLQVLAVVNLEQLNALQELETPVLIHVPPAAA